MSRELKVGIFLAIAALILALFIFIVGDLATLFKKPGYPLYVSFDSVAGLEERAVVRMAGVKAGYVRDIQLVEKRSQVLMTIFPKFKVFKGSKATLAALGLLGEKYIEILPGESADFCQPGETIEGLPAISFDQLGTLFLSIGDEVKEMSKAIRALVGEESKTDLREILQNLTSFSADLKEFLGKNRESLDQGISNTSQAVQNFDRRISEVSESLDKTIDLLNEIAVENRDNVKINLERIKELISKIEESVRLLSESLEKINKGEGTLGKLIQEPELYRKAEETLDEVRKTIAPISSFRAGVEFRSDYYGKSEELKNSLTLGLWLTPEKYLLTQVVRDPWLDKFKYSLQGGRRWGGIAAHAGIIESEFGAGIDYLTLGDRLTLSLESFNFNRQPRPQFRFLAKYAPQKFFSFILGLDDFTLASKREIFFGLGLGLE